MRGFAVGIVVAALAGWLCLADGVQAQEPRFDVAAEQCRPYRKGVIDRQWQVSAPRTQQLRPGFPEKPMRITDKAAKRTLA